MFGDVLRKERIKKGLTQEQLGEMINKSKNNISQYETGKREPDLSTLNKFAEIFNCTVDYLLGRVDDRDLAIYEKDKNMPNFLAEKGVQYITVVKDALQNDVSIEKLKQIIELLKKEENK